MYLTYCESGRENSVVYSEQFLVKKNRIALIFFVAGELCQVHYLHSASFAVTVYNGFRKIKKKSDILEKQNILVFRHRQIIIIFVNSQSGTYVSLFEKLNRIIQEVTTLSDEGLSDQQLTACVGVVEP